MCRQIARAWVLFKILVLLVLLLSGDMNTLRAERTIRELHERIQRLESRLETHFVGDIDKVREMILRRGTENGMIQLTPSLDRPDLLTGRIVSDRNRLLYSFEIELRPMRDIPDEIDWHPTTNQYHNVLFMTLKPADLRDTDRYKHYFGPPGLIYLYLEEASGVDIPTREWEKFPGYFG